MRRGDAVRGALEHQIRAETAPKRGSPSVPFRGTLPSLSSSWGRLVGPDEGARSRSRVNQQEEHHVALPKLMGQPAYARPPRPVDVQARPFDPDDLPLVAEMTDEERDLAASLPAMWGGDGQPNSDGNRSRRDLAPRPFLLRSLAGKLLGGQ